ncbi:luciferin sulfotransferase [Tribolium castaneum]|uniref:Sulfotransferase 1A2-like Protein n=1 Tax=Tribolium castaneum TaxID=7070 RepID=D7EL30_TRICA|nr:PREDICTED: sulfotransferase 1A1 [Tribolium castaneum]EFA11828.1 Sulfotransferase 1A2-like Protein [Tribolium castaneum]|eukprot:XP_008193080.1 PREDICTED: sulfotransferase 1A1 [Tribolium castaneum]
MSSHRNEQDKWINPSKREYVPVEGFTLTDQFKQAKNQIDNFEVSDNDIWISTFPKSGTTWTQEMVWLIFNNLDFEKAKQNLNDRSPFLEISTLIDYQNLMKTCPDIQIPESRLDSIKFVKNQKGPKVIKTHLPWELLPKQIQNGVKKPKIIYVARNPKDVCVSFFNHEKLISGYSGTFDEFCELFLDGKVLYAPYWHHVLTYWKMRNTPNFLFLKYEDMKRDLSKVIQKVSEFLERPLNDEQVEILLEHLSFEKMKQNPAVNKEDMIDIFKKHNLTNSDGQFFRSGKIGDYKVTMSSGMIKRFDEWIKRNTEGSDYVV